MTHYWRIRKWRPDRFGHHCRILARGRMNSCLILFGDGERIVASRWFVRKLPKGA